MRPIGIPLLLLAFEGIAAPQITYITFHPSVASSAYAEGKGSIRWIDEGLIKNVIP